MVGYPPASSTSTYSAQLSQRIFLSLALVSGAAVNSSGPVEQAASASAVAPAVAPVSNVRRPILAFCAWLISWRIMGSVGSGLDFIGGSPKNFRHSRVQSRNVAGGSIMAHM